MAAGAGVRSEMSRRGGVVGGLGGLEARSRVRVEGRGGPWWVDGWVEVGRVGWEAAAAAVLAAAGGMRTARGGWVGIRTEGVRRARDGSQEVSVGWRGREGVRLEEGGGRSAGRSRLASVPVSRVVRRGPWGVDGLEMASSRVALWSCGGRVG